MRVDHMRIYHVTIIRWCCENWPCDTELFLERRECPSSTGQGLFIAKPHKKYHLLFTQLMTPSFYLPILWYRPYLSRTLLKCNWGREEGGSDISHLVNFHLVNIDQMRMWKLTKWKVEINKVNVKEWEWCSDCDMSRYIFIYVAAKLHSRDQEFYCPSLCYCFNFELEQCVW